MPRATGTKSAKSKLKVKPAESYKHPEADSPMRPEVGTQTQFKKKLPPKTYKYDSSLSPDVGLGRAESSRVSRARHWFVRCWKLKRWSRRRRQRPS